MPELDVRYFLSVQINGYDSELQTVQKARIEVSAHKLPYILKINSITQLYMIYGF